MAPQESIRPAASVILYREAPALEFYLVERPKNTRFFPAYHVFPGGVLEKGETFAQGALRELEEETGIHLEGPQVLLPAGRLLTPPFGPVRFDTQFFFARLPPGQEPRVDGSELVSGKWWRPGAALEAWDRGQVPLPPPTLAFLRIVMREHEDVRGAAAITEATNDLPHHKRFLIEIHPQVYVLPLRAPTLPPATTQNCFLLATPEGIHVVDPGTPDDDEREVLAHTVEELIHLGLRPRAILLTHHHHDHVASARFLRERFPFEVWAHAHTAAHVDVPVDRHLADDEVIDCGWDEKCDKPWRVRVLHTPGHAPGHLAFLDERHGALFAGDLVSGVSTILIHPGEGDMGQYMASLERCAQARVTIVLPGHGPAQPGNAILRGTLEHRRAREKKVVDALSRGAATVDELLPVVYDDTPKEAYPLAAQSLQAHLDKLLGEGQVTEQGGRFARSH